ncbi:MAG TPA: formate dehydrogenase accessory sulfurtransferase FdhD [Nocardioides sp.]|uniref:formate dehydrogenase accessory sulfurtransferase FdhD n=1 Tax=Nocardioides sp. TaxID=35761 RepID=UPI002F41D900
MTDLARRTGPVSRLRVIESLPAGDEEHEDRVAAEEPLEIRIAWPGAEPRRAWVTMRTPGHDFELAAGWAFHEGLIGPDDLTEVAYCTDEDLAPEQEFNVVTLRASRAVDLAHRHDAMSTGSSACGVCGKDSIEAALSTVRGPRWDGPPPRPDVVRRLPALLREEQSVFATTGGVHAAGLFTADGDRHVVREDVGRHNAVDKVTGARLLAARPVADAYLVVSGRAGFELVQKAVTTGVGSLVAVGAPSSLAVHLAREAGLGLFGFTREERTVRYA